MQIANNIDKWLIIHWVVISWLDHCNEKLVHQNTILTYYGWHPKLVEPQDPTNCLRWYGTWPIMVCAFSKYAGPTRASDPYWIPHWSWFKSMFVYFIWSRGIHAGMMRLTTNLCQWNILSHGINPKIDWFCVMFNIGYWWAFNQACACSLNWSPTWALASSIFLRSTQKYAMYPTFLKRCYTWHGWQLALTGKKKWLVKWWLAILFLEVQ
jgi:hypothetical protein